MMALPIFGSSDGRLWGMAFLQMEHLSREISKRPHVMMVLAVEYVLVGFSFVLVLKPECFLT
jgi:hypothetical protein